MKKTYFIILSTIIMGGLNAQIFEKKYPDTKKTNQKNIYFNEEIKDPYRWLEDDLATDTKKWVIEQNKLTYSYLNEIPFLKSLKKSLTDKWNYEKISTPFREGKYIYYYKNNGLQQHSVLYRKLENGKEEIFLDPNKFSKDGSTSLSNISFTKDGSLVAYSISEGGSDWRKVIVLKTDDKSQVGETLVDVKFSGIAWKGNDGFYYSSYDKPKGSELSQKTEHHKLFYHKLGTLQKNDQLIFGGVETPRRYVNAYLTEDERFLVISASETTTGNELYIKDFSKENSKILPILKNFDSNTHIVDNDGEQLYLITNLDAKNNKLVRLNANDLNINNWETIIPETNNVLSISRAGGFFFASYLKDATSYVEQYKYDGTKIREITLPGLGSAYGFGGKKKEKEIYYIFSNYITPTTSYKLNVDTGKSDLYIKPNVKFKPEDFISEKVFYTSKDGTKIPMMITYKKGLKKDHKNPTIVYGYGGFNISLTPYFSPAIAVWLEEGGIYAVPNLRGGGEYGKEWHDAGRQLNKKNVFNDFIAAAEYLHQNNYTSPDYTAISGGSNGGLLVGATMTINPKIAKVALPAVGVLDMLRYHTFTAGAGWKYDYGTAEDNPNMFNYLKSYSPVHNVKKGECYPATLITTGDHDDRVVPAHSYKFAAELQDKQDCKNPVLIRIETKAGHGAGRSTEVIINETADKYAFILWNMGIKKLNH